MTRVEDLETVHLVTMPEKTKMEHGKLYVSMEFRLAIHLCACGWCNEQTVTPFILEGESDFPPKWKYTEVDGKVTLHPSIGNMNMPCKSHYWVQNGKVVGWC